MIPRRDVRVSYRQNDSEAPPSLLIERTWPDSSFDSRMQDIFPGNHTRETVCCVVAIAFCFFFPIRIIFFLPNGELELGTICRHDGYDDVLLTILV